MSEVVRDALFLCRILPANAPKGIAIGLADNAGLGTPHTEGSPPLVHREATKAIVQHRDHPAA
jgi:hypothetical protein